MRKRTPAIMLTRTFILVALLTGCTAANIGIRPNPAPFKTTDSACTQFAARIEYSRDLQEAYHSRASQNRFWLYAAAAMGIGTIAATGGLGAAGAASLSIALLSVSGGFTTGLFAILDNSDIAQNYTIAANGVADDIVEAWKIAYPPAGSGEPTDKMCADALTALNASLTKTSNALELARTDTAAGALMRAEAQQKELQKVIASLKDTGAAGATGPTGATGATGATGPTGAVDPAPQ